MNNIINKFLLTADRFMPEAYLKDLKVGTYSACGPFTRHKDRINKFIQTGDTNYMYKNELDKHVLLMMLLTVILKTQKMEQLQTRF